MTIFKQASTSLQFHSADPGLRSPQCSLWCVLKTYDLLHCSDNPAVLLFWSLLDHVHRSIVSAMFANYTANNLQVL